MASDLEQLVASTATELGVPGAAVGLLIGDEVHTAFHGVTSVEHPVEVDEQTLFQIGSTGKTFTSTALLRLVEQGHFDLDTRVRELIPELVLQDPSVAERVTVLQLTNHTAGWAGDLLASTGEGDDALARFVTSLADVDQITPLGAVVSYNNASLSLAGRIIEKVTGRTYEQAIRELLFEPLGMTSSWYFPNEVMTRRFAVGHHQAADGTVSVARPWALPRNASPAGGITTTIADQLTWARFHLGDGTAADGTRVLGEELLRSMQVPTADMRGSSIGDHVGISWLLRDVGGVRMVGHGGTTLGQHAAFQMVPERGFALVANTNCGPNGPLLNRAILQWALREHVGVEAAEPEPEPRPDAALAEYAGHYGTVATDLYVTVAAGHLSVRVQAKPETIAATREAGADLTPTQQPPVVIGMLPGTDRYAVVEGPAKGMAGYFVRDDAGAVIAVNVSGRLATRQDAPPA